MRTLALTAALVSAATAANSDHWAVLVAGSKGYSNYRHQADIAHAYQIMKAQGIPESNIITFAYDDIADNWQNPLKGQLFNQPNGENVYDASAIDYSGKDVTPEKFLAVLTGDKATAGGKVLESTSASKVFINFSDHGAPGLIAFPSQYLYADKLQDAFDTMESNNMYSQITFYLEACESGSMFPNLRADQNIYAVTASNATQSSWAAYCGSDAVVDGVNIGSCLGDLFSVNWMEDSDSHNLYSETLTSQFDTVQKLTTASPVMKFGDFDFMGEPVGDFQGVDDSASPRYSEMVKGLKQSYSAKPSKANKSELVDSRDVELHYLYSKAAREGGDDAHRELIAEIESRMFHDNLFSKAFAHHADQDLVAQPEDFECLRFTIDSVEENCGKFTDYSLKYIKHLVHTCETESPFMITKILHEISDICKDIM